jgi:hypothetical protein
LRVRRRRLADLVRADASANEPSSGPRGTGRVGWRAPAEIFLDSLLPRCRTRGRLEICTIKIASPRTFTRDSALLRIAQRHVDRLRAKGRCRGVSAAPPSTPPAACPA